MTTGPGTVVVVVMIVGTVRTLMTVTVYVTVWRFGGGVLVRYRVTVFVLVSKSVLVVRNRTVTTFCTVSTDVVTDVERIVLVDRTRAVSVTVLRTVSVTKMVDRTVPGAGQDVGGRLVGGSGLEMTGTEQIPWAASQPGPQWSSVLPHLEHCQATATQAPGPSLAPWFHVPSVCRATLPVGRPNTGQVASALSIWANFRLGCARVYAVLAPDTQFIALGDGRVVAQEVGDIDPGRDRD